jgi:multicomponent Na+:H+ antiporter subunit D
MLIAMGMAAFLCVFLGIYPAPLFDILPFPVEYVPYTAAHVVGQLQLLMFGALAFTLLILSGVYPAEMRAINLDTDWFYRKGGKLFFNLMDKGLNALNRACEQIFAVRLSAALATFSRNSTVKMALAVLIPLRSLMGAGDDKISALKKEVDEAFASGTTPLGPSAVLVALFLVIFYFIF